MAKHLLSNVLTSVLGEFVEDFKPENLKLGVWNGNIALRRVRLNREGINKLNLPVEFASGFIDTLEIHIPWTSLESRPVQILINGVYLMVKPLDLTTISSEKAIEQARTAKRGVLERAERNIELVAQLTESAGEPQKKSSYFKSLTTKIIDNLEVEVKNVHIRYEDNFSIPGTVCATGLTLESFVITTTDKDWQPSFVTRKSSEAVHKLSSINNTAIYWNTSCNSLGEMGADEWVESMRRYVEAPKSERPRMEYIVPPGNHLSMRITHNDSPKATPKLSVAIDGGLSVKLDKMQYVQALNAVTNMKNTQEWLSLTVHRPTVSASRNAREWWRYALILVTKNPNIMTDNMEVAMLCCRERKRYMNLLRESKDSDSKKPSSSCESEIANIEALLPTHTLVVFRQLVMTEHILQTVKAKENPVTVPAKVKGWLESFFDGKKGAKHKDASANPTSENAVPEPQDMTLSQIQDNIQNVVNTDKTVSAFTADLTLCNVVNVSISSHGETIASMGLNLSFAAAKREDSFDASMIISKFLMTDELSPNPVVPSIVDVQPPQEGDGAEEALIPELLTVEKPFCGFSVNSSEGKSVVKFLALPLELCFNKICIRRLLDVFSAPKKVVPIRPSIPNKNYHDSSNVSRRALKHSQHLHSGKSNVSDEIDRSKEIHHAYSQGVEIYVDINGPKVLIPEDFGHDMGLLVLDTGRLSVRGNVSPKGVMNWEIKVRDIHSWMPRSVDARFQSADSFLIQPFELSVNAQNENKTVANMTVDASLGPTVKSDITPIVLARLLHISEELSFALKPPDRAGKEDLDEVDKVNYSSNRNRLNTSGAKKVNSAVEPGVRIMLVSLKIGEISICMHSDSTHSLIFSVSNMASCVGVRSCDMEATVSLEGLGLQRSVQNQQSHIIKSIDDKDFLSLIYTQVNHIDSPLEYELSKTINVNFGRLGIFVDSHSLLHMRPFCEVLLGKQMVQYQSADSRSRSLKSSGDQTLRSNNDSSNSMSRVLSRKPSEVSTKGDKPVPGEKKTNKRSPVPVALSTAPPDGLSLDFKMNGLLVSFLRAVEGASDHGCEESNSSLPIEVSEVVLLEDIASLHIDGFYVGLKASPNKINADITLQSISAKDIRESSAEFAYRYMLCPVSYSPVSGDTVSDQNKSDKDSICGQDNPKQLSVSFWKDNVEDVTDIDVLVRDITAFVSLDAMLDLASVAQSCVESALSLMEPIADDPHLDDMNATKCVNEVNQSECYERGTSPSQSEIRINARVQIISPQLIFLEDPLNKFTRALVCRITCNTEYRKAPDSCGSSVDHVLLSVDENEIFIVPSLINWTPNQIMRSTGLELSVTKTDERLKVHLDVDDYVTNISLSDISLAQAVLMRATLVDKPPQAQQTDSVSSQGKNELKSNNNSGLPSSLSVHVDVKHIAVSLVNNLDTAIIPLFRLGIECIEFETNGRMSDISGSGSASFQAKYYNRSIHAWEPIVEQWTPSFAICVSEKEMRFNLSADKSLQCNITSSLLSIVADTGNLISEGSVSNNSRIESRSLVIRNCLEVPVSLYDSATNSSIFQRALGSNEVGVLSLSEDNIPSEDVVAVMPKGVFPDNLDICFEHTKWENVDCVKSLPLGSISIHIRSLRGESRKNMMLYWDCSERTFDGQRVISLRSSVYIKNSHSYAIQLKTDDGTVFGPINSGSMGCVPLSCVSSTESVFLRPVNDCSYKWSEPIKCELSSSCPRTDKIVTSNPSDSNKASLAPVVFSGRVLCPEDSVCIEISPLIVIINTLLSSLEYKFSYSLSHKHSPSNDIEYGRLAPGSSAKIRSVVFPSDKITLSFHLAPYGWSDGQLIAPSSSYQSPKYNLKVPLRGSHEAPDLLLRVSVERDPTSRNPTKIYIYSKELVIDRTGLGVAVKASGMDKIFSHGHHVRSTGTRDTTICSDNSSLMKAGKVEDCASAVDLRAFEVHSRRKYNVSSLTAGSLVHTDRSIRFSYVPNILLNATYICTPADDRLNSVNGGSVMVFKTDVPVFVCLFVDKRLKKLPDWMYCHDYREFSILLTALDSSKKQLVEHFYGVYGRMYEAGETISLRTGYSSQSKSMYSACVVAIDRQSQSHLNLIQDIDLQGRHDDSSEMCWVEGSHGVTYFSTRSNGKLNIGIDDGAAWCQSDISMAAVGGEKGTFEILHERKHYQLAYKIYTLPGIFQRTKALTVMPRYAVTNFTEEDIQISSSIPRRGDGDMTVTPFASKPWHKPSSASHGTNVHFKIGSSEWSLGQVDINEIGITELLLPYKDGSSNEPAVINVGVKLALSSDNCAISIVIWKSRSPEAAPISIRNNTSESIIVRQKYMTNETQPKSSTNGSYDVLVAPNSWVPFGWACPQNERIVVVTTGTSFSSNEHVVDVNTREISKRQDLICTDGSKKSVFMSYELGGWVVEVSVDTNDENDRNEFDEAHPKTLSFVLDIAGLGLSLVADSPTRRELLNFYLQKLDSMYSIEGTATSISLNIGGFQIDNYSESVVYPVLFRPIDQKKASSNNNENSHGDDFIQFSLVQEKFVSASTSLNFTVIKYLSGRILPFLIEIDSATIQLLLSDWLSGATQSSPISSAEKNPEQWIAKYSERTLSCQDRRYLVDGYEAHNRVRLGKLLFENVVLHPVMLSVTFLHMDLPSSREDTKHNVSSYALDLLSEIANVQGMQLKFGSFIVSNAVDAKDSMADRVKGKYLRDVALQLGSVLGSLTIIGSPAGLVRNISGGVQDFFYEPAAGIVQSPQDFVVGLSKGTTKLVSGVVGGALSSTAAVVGSVSTGVSYFSGDSDYVRERALKKQRQAASKSGAASGIKDGGSNVLSGIGSGVTGLFTKPIQGAKEGGVVGLFKGIGQGVAGAAIKPVLGITDGLTSITQGISNQLGDEIMGRGNIRPPRALVLQSINDPESPLVLPELSIPAAVANAYVSTINEKNSTNDVFISVITPQTESQVIFTRDFVYVVTIGKSLNEWKVPWSNFSHVMLVNGTIRIFVLKKDGELSCKIIPCSSADTAKELYSEFMKHTARMQSSKNCTTDEAHLNFYVFGTKNNMLVPAKALSVEQFRFMASEKLDIPENVDVNGIRERIDEAAVWMVKSWSTMHKADTRRCCVVALINRFSEDVNIHEIGLECGNDCFVVGSCKYYASREKSLSGVLSQDGFLVLFSHALPPTFSSSGCVKLLISTTSGSVSIGTGSSFLSKSEARPSMQFLEKTIKPCWGKYVLEFV